MIVQKKKDHNFIQLIQSFFEIIFMHTFWLSIFQSGWIIIQQQETSEKGETGGNLYAMVDHHFFNNVIPSDVFTHSAKYVSNTSLIHTWI